MALDTITAIKLAYLMGWINIIGLLLVLLSCRCIPNFIPAKVRESHSYQKFFEFHCYYWWFFVISVVAHAIIAIMAFRNF